jgi:hypothetical protein
MIDREHVRFAARRGRAKYLPHPRPEVVLALSQEREG